MWAFTPDTKTEGINVPYFEEARSDFAPYYSTTKTVKSVQDEVKKQMEKLNAVVLDFQSGTFTVNGQNRFGYAIEFLMNGASGRIVTAGLPIKWYTMKKEQTVRAQCLLNVRDWLKAAVTMQVFSPDTSPLIPYLLVPGADGQQHTVAEYILSRGQLPALASQSVTVERE